MPNTKNCPSKAETCRQEARTVKEFWSMAWAWEGCELSQGPGSNIGCLGNNSGYQCPNSSEVVTALGRSELYPLLGFCQTLYTYCPQFGFLTQTPPTKWWDMRGGNRPWGWRLQREAATGLGLAQVTGGMASGALNSSSTPSHQYGTYQREQRRHRLFTVVCGRKQEAAAQPKTRGSGP